MPETHSFLSITSLVNRPQLFPIPKAGSGTRTQDAKLFLVQPIEVTTLYYPPRRFPYEAGVNFWSLENSEEDFIGCVEQIAANTA